MKKILTMATWLCAAIGANAQTGSDYMQPFKKADANITFDVTDEGKPFRVKWGMDTAWNWDYNVNKGVAHIGKGNFETGRISFQPTEAVIDNGDGTYELTAKQKSALRSRCNNILLTGCNQVSINNDQEDALNKENGNYEKYQSLYLNKPEAWYKLIKASVAYAKECGVEVVSISPFNEPDFSGWGQGTKNSMREICRLIKADPYFDNIRVCAGNTLNCDYALEWYNYCLDYIDEGNTHQLAGSFDNYANFFTKVKADGKVATADELHNVGEAIVGVEYGMETGIWWGFHAKARGQFCLDSNQGVRLGYGENRPAWTCGAVYRNDKTGEVHGYFGSSERQAVASSFAYISKGKDVFFNGYGPTRMFVYDVPGGKTGDYQSSSQINAERLFDITWGEDVAPGEINGTYQIMNASSKKMLTYNGSSNVLSSTRKSSGTTQQWKVYPGYVSLDVSYWFIDNVTTNSTKVNLNVLNNNLNSGAGVICWDAGHGEVEQWYLKYAKDGYYYIISCLSNKYLYCNNVSSGTSVTLQAAPADNITATELKKYLWRFQPVDSKAEVVAPAAPTQLKAVQRNGSIQLSWTAPDDEDLASYTILRGIQTENGIDWNTIGRNDTLTTFLDNTVTAGNEYIYKVVAVDYAGNRSEASDTLHAAPLKEQALLCQIQFDGDTKDNSANRYDAQLYGSLTYSTSSSLMRSGSSSGNFSGKSYAMLPYAVANQDEMTISTWVRWASNGDNWQRVFDFGNGTDQYMFFCPSNGSQMRFVMKNGGDEQILSNGKRMTTNAWHHIAITLKPVGDKVQAILYLDGANVAESNEFTIKPSDIAPSLCFIGRSMFPNDPFFNGRLDDFRIYNYALTAEEVAGVMTDREAISKDLDEVNEAVGIKAIEDTTSKRIHSEDAWYDLSGRRTQPAATGVYIQNGKKYYQR